MSALVTMREAARLVRALVLRWMARLSRSQAGIVLVYHGVGGDVGDPEVQIDPGVATSVFEAQLRHVHRNYRVVPAAQILRATRERRRGQRFPVAITLDDDLRSHVREALPALQRARAVATFFLCGLSLREPETFWWQDLQRAIDGRHVRPDALPHVAETDVRSALEGSPRAIRSVASAIERLEPAQRSEVAHTLRRAAGPPPIDAGVRFDDARSLAAAGFDVGFHTLRHDPLPALADAALERALREGREELDAAVGQRLDMIAYPHGKADARVAGASRSAGFALGFTTSWGLVAPDTDPLLIPRVVPASSASAFALQLARAFARRL